MKKLLSIMIALTATLSMAAQTPEQWDSLRTMKWSIYGQQGVSFASGGDLISNIDPSPGTQVKHMFGGGVTLTFRPWVRASINYAFSKYYREQRFGGSVTDVNADDILLYRQMRKMYHVVDLMAEFNIMELWKNRQNKRFNLWLGIGRGGIFTTGPDYVLTTSSSRDLQATSEAINSNFIGHTTRGTRNSFYTPVALHMEYDVLPQLSLGLRAQIDMLEKHEKYDLPFATELIGATVRYNFVKTPYKEPVVRIVERVDTVTVTVEDGETIQRLNDKINALRKLIVGKRTVYFDNDSFTLTDKAVMTLDDVANLVEQFPDLKFWITGSTDAYANADYNLRLSESRVKTVQRALISRGIPASSIVDTRWVGKEGQNYDPSCRRVIIDIQ